MKICWQNEGFLKPLLQLLFTLVRVGTIWFFLSVSWLCDLIIIYSKDDLILLKLPSHCFNWHPCPNICCFLFFFYILLFYHPALKVEASCYFLPHSVFPIYWVFLIPINLYFHINLLLYIFFNVNFFYCCLLYFIYAFNFWPHRTTCGILVPQPGIEPTPPALEGGLLTTGPPGKSLLLYILIHSI